jgi:hypothetical protein
MSRLESGSDRSGDLTVDIEMTIDTGRFFRLLQRVLLVDKRLLQWIPAFQSQSSGTWPIRNPDSEFSQKTSENYPSAMN